MERRGREALICLLLINVVENDNDKCRTSEEKPNECRFANATTTPPETEKTKEKAMSEERVGSARGKGDVRSSPQ
eukprot:scaffold84690_cov30-Tisochrysis_lutea.AAC.2